MFVTIQRCITVFSTIKYKGHFEATSTKRVTLKSPKVLAQMLSQLNGVLASDRARYMSISNCGSSPSAPDFDLTSFSCPFSLALVSGVVTPGILGRFGGLFAKGELRHCIRKFLSYMILVPPGVVENNVPPGVWL